MFELLVENDLNYSNLSSFKARDLSLNELLAISPEIYKILFVDLSEVWCRVLIIMSKQSRVSGNLLNLLCEFIKLRESGELF